MRKYDRRENAIRLGSFRVGKQVATLSDDYIGRFSVGAIRLDTMGMVYHDIKCERLLMGSSEHKPLRENVFTNIARRLAHDDFRSHINRKRTSTALDSKFSCLGDLGNRSCELDVLIQSSTSDGMWMLLRR